MKKSVLRAYARLIAESGVNVQKGQEVFITAGLDQPEFVAMVVEECYRRKAEKGRRRLELSAADQTARPPPVAHHDEHA